MGRYKMSYTVSCKQGHFRFLAYGLKKILDGIALPRVSATGQGVGEYIDLTTRSFFIQPSKDTM